MDEPNTAAERPQITRYTDYRAYLRDMYAFLKATRPGFSYRSFSRRAGFASGSFLKLVSDGHRNLSDDSTLRVARGLGLDAREADVLEALVAFNQADTDQVRDRHYQRLARLVDRDPVARLSADHYAAYSRWYPWIIRELAAHDDFDEDPVRLGRRLRPRVRPAAVSRALELLQSLGLLVRDAADRLRPAERTLTTGAEVRTLAVRNFHRRMLELAIEALDKIPRAERNITSVTVTLDPPRYQRVLALLAQLRQEILAVERSDTPSAPEDGPAQVYQLTLSLIPMTQEIDP
ncbi:MAG: TIGR02147 family protein [Deltaproteobacteria bacterium]|nr:MAG: TIGR02147 family protein [Deltaproteobacteria bacterium]